MIGFVSEPATEGERVMKLSPIITGCKLSFALPGAHAPGFILTPASQAKERIGQAFSCKTDLIQPLPAPYLPSAD